MSKFRTKIKIHRARFSMTQQDLADAVNVRRETIVHLEQGKYMPSLELAYRISQVFGMPIEEVFELENPKIAAKTGPATVPRCGTDEKDAGR